MNNVALKEWAVAVRAMEQGMQDVMFRKGGIQEAEGDFQLKHMEFLLYPAREHQKPEFLKPQFLPLLQQTRAEQRGHVVTIRSRCKIFRVTPIKSLEEALPYQDRHIWNTDFIQIRLDYKPDRPLYVLEFNLTPLNVELEFVESTEYAGCKSWVDLHE